MIRRLTICLALAAFTPAVNAQTQARSQPLSTARLLLVGGKHQHVHGANLAWLNGMYSHDFAHKPHQPDEQVYFNEGDLDRYFADMHGMNLNVCRIWVFEDLEGLMMDRDGYVKGLDPLVLENWGKAIDLAKRNGIQLYLCLANNFTKPCKEHHFKNIITDQEARHSYLHNAVKPFVERFQGSDGIFAYDIMNEPESEVAGPHGNGKAEGCTWQQMRTFISLNARTIHQADRKALVSCGSGWHSWENLKFGLYTGLGLDFYDYHVYEDFRTHPVPPVHLLGLKLPVIVGEFNLMTNDDQAQKEAVAACLDQLRTGVYAGALLWAYDCPGAKDGATGRMLRGNGSSEWRPAAQVMHDFQWGPASLPAVASDVRCRLQLSLTETGDCRISLGRAPTSTRADRPGKTGVLHGLPQARVQVESGGVYTIALDADRIEDLKGIGANYMTLDKPSGTFLFKPVETKVRDRTFCYASMNFPRYLRLPYSATIDITSLGANVPLNISTLLPKGLLSVNITSEDDLKKTAGVEVKWRANAREEVLSQKQVRLDDSGQLECRLPIPSDPIKEQVLLSIGMSGKSFARIRGIEVKSRIVPKQDMILGESRGVVFVKALFPEGVAIQGGVATGDVLLAINGTKPKSVSDANRLFAETPIGETITLTLLTAGKERTVRIKAE